MEDRAGGAARIRTGWFTRALARICAGCPLCRARRRRPDSRLARIVGRYERFCPACRAFRRLRMTGDGRA